MAREPAKIASDFQCHLCGSVLTPEQDQRLHLEKRARRQGLRRNHKERNARCEKADLGVAAIESFLMES